jgi:GNAT superfamily N-acetyltransferase
MVPFAPPSYVVRPAERREAGLIGYLRMASLLCLEMPGYSLDAVRAVMMALPDVDAELIAAGRYVVVESGGDLLGGVGWSVLPLSFRADRLIDDSGRPADPLLGHNAVLLRGFFLDPDLGRHGIGANLVARIEADAAREGHCLAEVLLASSGQRLYRSMGYKLTRRLGMRFAGADLVPIVQMRKSLAARLAVAA